MSVTTVTTEKPMRTWAGAHTSRAHEVRWYGCDTGSIYYKTRVRSVTTSVFRHVVTGCSGSCLDVTAPIACVVDAMAGRCGRTGTGVNGHRRCRSVRAGGNVIQFSVMDGALLAMVTVWAGGMPREVIMTNVYRWVRTRRAMSALTRAEWSGVLGLWPQPGGDA